MRAKAVKQKVPQKHKILSLSTEKTPRAWGSEDKAVAGLKCWRQGGLRDDDLERFGRKGCSSMDELKGTELKRPRLEGDQGLDEADGSCDPSQLHREIRRAALGGDAKRLGQLEGFQLDPLDVASASGGNGDGERELSPDLDGRAIDLGGDPNLWLSLCQRSGPHRH